jgi:hypothetical protein
VDSLTVADDLLSSSILRAGSLTEEREVEHFVPNSALKEIYCDAEISEDTPLIVLEGLDNIVAEILQSQVIPIS